MFHYSDLLRLPEETIAKFKTRIVETPTCWGWCGMKDPKNYGLFRIDKVNHLAHRLSYFIYKGSYENTLLVCHKCDNPNCVNPRHLFLGTQKENIADMIVKGRANTASGDASGASKLSATALQDIFYLKTQGLLNREIAKIHGVSATQISRILAGTRRAYARTDYQSIIQPEGDSR